MGLFGAILTGNRINRSFNWRVRRGLFFGCFNLLFVVGHFVSRRLCAPPTTEQKCQRKILSKRAHCKNRHLLPFFPPKRPWNFIIGDLIWISPWQRANGVFVLWLQWEGECFTTGGKYDFIGLYLWSWILFIAPAFELNIFFWFLPESEGKKMAGVRGLVTSGPTKQIELKIITGLVC